MDLLHRIRWANVARAAALVAAVLLLVSWPRLRAEPPPLPPQPEVVEEQAPVPAGEVAFEAGAEPAPTETRAGAVRRERVRVKRRGRAKRRASARRGRSERREPGARSATPAVTAPRVEAAPAPIATPRVWTPPRTEFGFEGR